MGHSEVFTNPRLKLKGPYMVPSRVVSNPREKEPFPSEKTFLKTKGPYMVPSEQITKTRQKSPNVKGLSSSIFSDNFPLLLFLAVLCMYHKQYCT